MAVLLMVQVRIRAKEITRHEKRPCMTRKETIQQENIITEVQNTESKMEAERPRNRSCSYGRGLEHTLLVNRIRRQKTKAEEVRPNSVGEISHGRWNGQPRTWWFKSKHIMLLQSGGQKSGVGSTALKPT